MLIVLLMMLGGMIVVNQCLSWSVKKLLLFVMFFLLSFSIVESKDYVCMGGGWGGDLVSFSLLMLTLWIGIMMFIGSEKWSGGYEESECGLVILLILMFLCLGFSVLDLFWFYIFFELTLIPMVVMISMFGYQPERLESGIYMLFYTSVGSLPFLVVVMSLKVNCSGSMLTFLLGSGGKAEWSILVLSAFLIKMPSYGCHIWLPKAHVEAPVSGSMVLAGVLLKLGGYGSYRLFPILKMSVFLQSWLVVSGLWGGLMSALICMRQLDLKKLIAYSSVFHMGLFLGGISTKGLVGFWGGLIMSISHGLCSSGLFYLVNLVYERTGSRSLIVSKGLLVYVPGLMLWCFLLSAANMAAPPFLSIFGEVYLSMSLVSWEVYLAGLLLLLFFSGVMYSVYFFSILCHGEASMSVKVFEVSVLNYLVSFLHFFPVFLLILKLDFFLCF